MLIAGVACWPGLWRIQAGPGWLVPACTCCCRRIAIDPRSLGAAMSEVEQSLFFPRENNHWAPLQTRHPTNLPTPLLATRTPFRPLQAHIQRRIFTLYQPQSWQETGVCCYPPPRARADQPMYNNTDLNIQTTKSPAALPLALPKSSPVAASLTTRKRTAT